MTSDPGRVGAADRIVGPRMISGDSADEAALTALLTQLEYAANRRGWDERPAGFVLYNHSDTATTAAYTQRYAARIGSPVRRGPYTAQPILSEQVLDGNLAVNLYRLAQNLHNASANPLLGLMVGELLTDLRQPGFLGIAVVCEGWALGGPEATAKAEEADRLRLSYADLPSGAVECRQVIAVDKDERAYAVLRIRGHEVRVDARVLGDMGSVGEAMHTVVNAVVERPLPKLTWMPRGLLTAADAERP